MATTGWILLFITACSFHLAAARAKSGVLFSNPCWGKPCHTYAKCEVVNVTQAVCVCPQNCTRVSKPVCGTNWKTYDNLCTLMAESCSRNDWNSLRYNGECKAGDCLNSIWQILNCPFHSECLLHYGLPRCVCPTEKCPTNYEPVCATDGRTYRNMCHMRQGSCRRKKLLRVRNIGHCKPDPCQFHECCCGATCRVNATNYPMCSCNFTCSRSSSRVCGSDGKTYDSPCDLRMASCMEQNMKLTQVSNGPCLGENVTPPPRTINPCLNQICSHHATCIVERGLAKCICPVCPTTRSPVCGSNGVTYQNRCFLNRASCVSMITITMARAGPCVVEPTTSTSDLCSLGECAHYSRCVVVRGVPKCVCPDLCPQVNAPVCGSDGVTYENDCAMRRASCKSEKTLIAHSRGPCELKPTAEPTKPTMDPCFEQSCTYHAECVVDRGLPKCVCPSNCPNTSTPVCGSNGVIYDNECLMKRESCIKQLTITVASAERCGPGPTLAPTENPCAMGMCAHYARCVVVQGQPRCVCPDLCPNIFSPQCGSDGQTYQNECSLKRKSCDKQSVISIVNAGPCATAPTEAPTRATGDCSTLSCDNFSTCKVVEGVPTCVCPNLCPGLRLPVCGSDGITYENECDLRRTSCLAGRFISTVRIGVCLRAPAPITQAPTPRVVLPPANKPCGEGRCVNYALCEVFQGQPRCVCPGPCAGPKSPVCGSDGRSYDSECELRRSSCTSQKTITVASAGFCEPVGRCPNPRLCSNECSQTNDICSLNGKMCCCLGCGLSCATPVWSTAMRQYLCPADPLGCRNDGDCSGGMICCDSGCTKRCIAPRL